MGNIKYIIITLVLSAVLLGLIGLWIGYRTGEVSLLGLSAPTLGKDDPLPGPLTDEGKEKNENQPSNNDATMNQATTTLQEGVPAGNPTAIFRTNKGDISIELFQDMMPITVGNFTKLAGEGFYNNTKFHRVMAGFMIQAGDPNSKGDNAAVYGQGGPGYTIHDEFVADPRLSNVRGTIAMANTGQPNSGGSQFFINLVDNTNLDYDKDPFSSKHPVFGKVVAGMDVVDAIGATATGPSDLPTDPIIISSIEIQ